MKVDNINTINMVENHIRTLNVIDDAVLSVLKKIPRKIFPNFESQTVSSGPSSPSCLTSRAYRIILQFFCILYSFSCH